MERERKRAEWKGSGDKRKRKEWGTIRKENVARGRNESESERTSIQKMELGSCSPFLLPSLPFSLPYYFFLFCDTIFPLSLAVKQDKLFFGCKIEVTAQQQEKEQRSSSRRPLWTDTEGRNSLTSHSCSPGKHSCSPGKHSCSPGKGARSQIQSMSPPPPGVRNSSEKNSSEKDSSKRIIRVQEAVVAVLLLVVIHSLNLDLMISRNLPGRRSNRFSKRKSEKTLQYFWFISIRGN